MVSSGGFPVIRDRSSVQLPQPSVLGPQLLSTVEVFNIIASLGLSAHYYIDDTQLCISAGFV